MASSTDAGPIEMQQVRDNGEFLLPYMLIQRADRKA